MHLRLVLLSVLLHPFVLNAQLRGPAVHDKAYTLESEAAYCTDIAKNFCPKVLENVKVTRKERTKKFEDKVDNIIAGLKRTDVHDNVFKLVLESLGKRGFPVSKKATAADLESSFVLKADFDEYTKKIEEIFSLKKDACKKNAKSLDYILELSLLASATIPRDSLVEELIESQDKNSNGIEKGYSAKLQNSDQAKRLVAAIDDYSTSNQDSKSEFGASFAKFSEEKYKLIERAKSESLAELKEWKPALAEHFFLCSLIDRLDDGLKEGPCDLSYYMEFSNIENYNIARIVDKQALSDQIKKMREELLNSYTSYLNLASKLNIKENTKKLFESWRRSGVNKASFYDKVKNVSKNYQDKMQKDMSPYFSPGSESEYSMYCVLRNQLISDAIVDEHSRVQLIANKSKQSVNYVLQNLYNKKQRQQLKGQFIKTKALVIKEFSQLEKVIQSKPFSDVFGAAIEKIGIYDPSSEEAGLEEGAFSLKSEYFVKDELTGVEALDLNRVPSHDFLYNLIAADNLDALKEVNAHVKNPALASMATNMSITMFPGFIDVYKDNPHTTMFTMAHEMAHVMDPVVFRDLGIKVPKELKKLFECLAKAKSAEAASHQHGECLSDWFATEVIAAMVRQETNKSNKFEIVKDSLVMLCEEQSAKLVFDPRSSDPHPSPRKRINGIIAAHPVLREAIGCRLQSDNKYCSMEAN